MKKILIIISLLLFTFACSSTYKVKPYKDKTPDDVVWPTQPSTAGPNS